MVLLSLNLFKQNRNKGSDSGYKTNQFFCLLVVYWGVVLLLVKKTGTTDCSFSHKYLRVFTATEWHLQIVSIVSVVQPSFPIFFITIIHFISFPFNFPFLLLLPFIFSELGLVWSHLPSICFGIFFYACLQLYRLMAIYSMLMVIMGLCF